MNVLEFASWGRPSISKCIPVIILFSCSTGVHHTWQKIWKDMNLKITQESKDASGEMGNVRKGPGKEFLLLLSLVRSLLFYHLLWQSLGMEKAVTRCIRTSFHCLHLSHLNIWWTKLEVFFHSSEFTYIYFLVSTCVCTHMWRIYLCSRD